MSLRVGTPLDSIISELKRAGDEWRLTLNLEAEAHNEFLRVHSIAWAQASHEGIAVTARGKHAENQVAVVEAKCAWNLAQARSRACHSKVEEQQSRLMAAQSNLKYMGKADGGSF